jgi:hypothetical protein
VTALQSLILWCAVIAALNIGFQAMVIRQRLVSRVGLGDGGKPEMIRAIRIHGNFLEQVPLVLAGLGLLAWSGASPLWIHAAGGLFVATRLAYAYGLNRTSGSSPGRMAGMFGTWGTLILSYTVAFFHTL